MVHIEAEVSHPMFFPNKRIVESTREPFNFNSRITFKIGPSLRAIGLKDLLGLRTRPRSVSIRRVFNRSLEASLECLKTLKLEGPRP